MSTRDATSNPLPPREDWLAAMDDLLCGRLHACTLCGRGPITWAHVWDDPDPASLVPAVAVVLCRACHNLGEEGYTARLRVLFTRRYALYAPNA